MECDFEIYAKNVSSRCRKTFACDISLSIKLEISNLTPPPPFLHPYSGHAHKNARQLKNEAAVGDICYLLRFVYITLYLESAMPEQCQAKPPLPPLPFRPLSSAALCHWFTYFSYTCRQHFNMCVVCAWAWHVNRGNSMPEKPNSRAEERRRRRIFAAHLTEIFQHICILTRLTCGIPPIALHDIINGLFIKPVKGNQCRRERKRGNREGELHCLSYLHK